VPPPTSNPRVALRARPGVRVARGRKCGTNEHTNALLGQYFPKGTDLSVYSQDHLDAVALELDSRLRQTLGWLKPHEKLDRLLSDANDALTG